MGFSCEKLFSECNEYDSLCQSKFNILSFKSSKFDMKQEILLIKHVLNIETSLKKHVQHSFIKYFSDTWVNQVVNKYLNCLVFAICKNDIWKLLLNKEMEWCQKSSIRMFSKLWQYQIVWYLFAGFKTIILCSVPLYDLSNTCFLLRYDSWKLQLESWNTNHESLNQTMVDTDERTGVYRFNQIYGKWNDTGQWSSFRQGSCWPVQWEA